MICNELVRRAFEIMGYDGIIDRSVNLKFGQGRRIGLLMLGVDASTNHMIAFEANKIKSATENDGEFSSENDDIRFRGSNFNAINGIDALQLLANGEDIVGMLWIEMTSRNMEVHQTSRLNGEMPAILKKAIKVAMV